MTNTIETVSPSSTGRRDSAAIAGPHRRLSLWRRWQESRRRALPSFLIIGTQKGGTTSLYRWLGQHPQICEASRKEVHYFDINYSRGERWYRAHFPLLRDLADERVTGEGSPYYMCHPHAPGRIASLLPDVRLIVLLRNPVERAISHYFHSHRNGREPFSIEQAMAQEESRIECEYERMRADGCYNSRVHRWFSYKARGRYQEQLQAVREHFAPEQLLILKSEDLFREPQRVYDSVCAHVGVRTGYRPPNLQPQLVGGYDQIDADPVRDSLRRYFEPHNAALADDVGRDFGWR